ncbi:hypothetical protein DPMN_140296 [Dreissena polymorpha]|uniref:Uncharacterized protein n=1 Tax=Dreissena polymorpha TaxID=45954 RepID=A0A9D4JIW7_DREPO|nr:hypothetical protein DPMN_140296 [Dreissena polymorpha]
MGRIFYAREDSDEPDRFNCTREDSIIPETIQLYQRRLKCTKEDSIIPEKIQL